MLAVGATGNDGSGSSAGHVRVYQFSSGSWTQIDSDIDGEAAGDNFGQVVALSGYGNRLVVGGPYNDGTGESAGHARVYELVGRLPPPPPPPPPGYGASLALTNAGTRVAVGYPGGIECTTARRVVDLRGGD